MSLIEQCIRLEISSSDLVMWSVNALRSSNRHICLFCDMFSMCCCDYWGPAGELTEPSRRETCFVRCSFSSTLARKDFTQLRRSISKGSWGPRMGNKEIVSMTDQTPATCLDISTKFEIICSTAVVKSGESHTGSKSPRLTPSYQIDGVACSRTSISSATLCEIALV
jgi:hypothetical protein